MAEDYTKNIEDSKKNLAEARDTLVNSYLGRLKELYDGGIEITKNFFVGKLELLVGEAESGFPIEEKSSKNAFNPAIAKSLRKKAGYKNQTDLGNILGILQGSISNYELGKFPQTNPQGKMVLKYLNWLKEQGYNPFNL